jgi:hypothetical protein
MFWQWKLVKDAPGDISGRHEIKVWASKMQL